MAAEPKRALHRPASCPSLRAGSEVVAINGGVRTLSIRQCMAVRELRVTCGQVTADWNLPSLETLITRAPWASVSSFIRASRPHPSLRSLWVVVHTRDDLCSVIDTFHGRCGLLSDIRVDLEGERVVDQDTVTACFRLGVMCRHLEVRLVLPPDTHGSARLCIPKGVSEWVCTPHHCCSLAVLSSGGAAVDVRASQCGVLFKRVRVDCATLTGITVRCAHIDINTGIVGDGGVFDVDAVSVAARSVATIVGAARILSLIGDHTRAFDASFVVGSGTLGRVVTSSQFLSADKLCALAHTHQGDRVSCTITRGGHDSVRIVLDDEKQAPSMTPAA